MVGIKKRSLREQFIMNRGANRVFTLFFSGYFNEQILTLTLLFLYDMTVPVSNKNSQLG